MAPRKSSPPAKVKAKVPEELRKVGEVQEAKLKENLQASKKLVRKLEAQVKEKDEKLATERALISELEAKMADTDSRRIIVEGRVRKLEVEVKAAQTTTDWAIEEYENSQDFEDEEAKGCLESLHLGFLRCKKVA